MPSGGKNSREDRAGWWETRPRAYTIKSGISRTVPGTVASINMLWEGTQEEALEFFQVEDPEGWELRRSSTSKEKVRRQFLSEEYAVRMEYVDSILWEFDLNWDEMQEAFASKENHRFTSYWTKSQNSFMKTWTDIQIWANPPFSLMDKVTLKCLGDEIKLAVIIVPVW